MCKESIYLSKIINSDEILLKRFLEKFSNKIKKTLEYKNKEWNLKWIYLLRNIWKTIKKSCKSHFMRFFL